MMQARVSLAARLDVDITVSPTQQSYRSWLSVGVHWKRCKNTVWPIVSYLVDIHGWAGPAEGPELGDHGCSRWLQDPALLTAGWLLHTGASHGPDSAAAAVQCPAGLGRGGPSVQCPAGLGRGGPSIREDRAGLHCTLQGSATSVNCSTRLTPLVS